MTDPERPADLKTLRRQTIDNQMFGLVTFFLGFACWRSAPWELLQFLGIVSMLGGMANALKAGRRWRRYYAELQREETARRIHRSQAAPGGERRPSELEPAAAPLGSGDEVSPESDSP